MLKLVLVIASKTAEKDENHTANRSLYNDYVQSTRTHVTILY